MTIRWPPAPTPGAPASTVEHDASTSPGPPAGESHPEPARNRWLPTGHGGSIGTAPFPPKDQSGQDKWPPADDAGQTAPTPAFPGNQSSQDKWLLGGIAQVSDPLGAQRPVDDAQAPVDDAEQPVEAHPDLPTQSAQGSLAESIRAGDADAAAGFYEAHVQKIRRYCAEVCHRELITEACEAAFVDFVARVRNGSERAVDLEDVLLQATRAAAAGRFVVEPAVPAAAGPPQPRAGDEATCAAMPELLAANANRELSRRNEEFLSHAKSCPNCEFTAARASRAEHAFAEAPLRGEDSGAGTGAGRPKRTSAVVPARVRRGGLIRAVKRLIRPPRQ